MACADDDTLARLLDGKLPEGERVALERHCGECPRCSAMFGELGAALRSRTAARPDSLVGRDVGRYRVIRKLGEGGMGHVYEAVHRDLGTQVALKVIADEHVHDPELAKRFVTEARAASVVRHERIVRVLDLFHTDDDRAVIVMDLVDGKTLRTLERASVLPIGGVVQIILDVLDALAAAHAAGITHRDLKPDNIIVEPSGRAKVLDFGIAKVARSAPGVAAKTRTGSTIGTPEYMSPEQVSGGEADPRADLYAVGVVLYEALAGERPYAGASDFELMRAHLEAPIPRLRAARPAVPPALEAVVTRALAKAPGDRFPDAAAMARALTDAAASVPAGERTRFTGSAPEAETPTARSDVVPVAATIATKREGPVSPDRGSRLAVIVIGGVAAAFAIGAVAWSWGRSSIAVVPDAAVVADAADVAPIDPHCRCVVDADDETYRGEYLCTTTRAPLCRCHADSSMLCPTPLEPCPNNVCDDFALDNGAKRYRCSIGVPGHWWARETEDAGCQGYDSPNDKLRDGKWACSVCARFDDVRRMPGAACSGHAESGALLSGHIVCKTHKRE
jgi:predicted Ser/Thr protein kinase